jgi:all-trans-retinol 13,14-reductase
MNHGKTTPRGYIPFEACSPVDRGEQDALRDSFKSRKIPASIDAIVIGSGISGLYLAASLARVGKKVLVLEQHYVAGGCTHVFEDKGFEFDTGLHYVGRGSKYGHLLDLMSTGTERAKLVQLGDESNGFCYDEIHLGDRPPHYYCRGQDRHVHDLSLRFPKYALRIQQYVDLCLKVNKSADPYVFGKLLSTVMKKIVHYFAAGTFFKYANKTLSQVLDELNIDQPELRAILAGQFGDYGLPPSKASFFIHAGVVCHYMQEGGFYVKGGPAMIARGLIPTIEKSGGRVLVKARVKHIVVSKSSGRACGVVMSDGTKIGVKQNVGIVCSTIGCRGTMKLLERAKDLGAIQKTLRWERSMVSGGNDGSGGSGRSSVVVENGISHMYAFIGLKGTKKELELRESNIWCLPVDVETFDLDEMCRKYYENPKNGLPNGEMLLFMGFPSAKDPEWHEKNPNQSTCVIITEAKTEWFQKWFGMKSGKRGKEYEEFKNTWKERLLNGLYKFYPKCRGNVEYVELGSPATNEMYLGRPDSYGLGPTPAKFLDPSMVDFSPKDNEIPGLYHSGQDTLTAGVFGCLMAGFVTAHAVLGYDWIDLLVVDRNLADDMANVPKK